MCLENNHMQHISTRLIGAETMYLGVRVLLHSRALYNTGVCDVFRKNLVKRLCHERSQSSHPWC